MINFRKEISKILQKHVCLSREETELLLEVPPQHAFGDYAFPCFKLASLLKKKPQEVSLELSKKIKLTKFFEKAEAKGPYLNFFVRKDFLAKEIISQVLKEKEKFGNSKLNNGKRIMVEYSQPNPNKPMHLGHLRNDSLGMAVSNHLVATSAKVIRANLINDRGIHISQTMLAYKKWGRGKSPKSEGIKPDHFVGKYYVLFHKKLKEDIGLEEEAQELLKKWEAKDKETMKLWKKITGWALKGFKQTYKEFGSKFDVIFHESDYFDKAKPLIELGKKKKLFFLNEDGILMADLKQSGLPNKTVLRADGTSIYLTNDLILTKHKFEDFKLDKAIWVVGSEQNLYFNQLFKILELLGFKWTKNCHHLSYGMVYLPAGKMKSREGTVVDADDLISKMKKLAEKEVLKREKKISRKALKDRAKKIALSAIKFFLLKVDSAKDIYFNPQESISFDGETGPYIQYTYARAKSILRKDKTKPDLEKIDFSLLKESKEIELVSLLSKFPEAVENSTKHLSPHTTCQFLLDLAMLFNSYYQSVPVLKAEKNLRNARLVLVEATSIVLKKGLALLNIEALEKM